MRRIPKLYAESDVLIDPLTRETVGLQCCAELLSRHADRFIDRLPETGQVTCARVTIAGATYDLIVQTWWTDASETAVMTLCALRSEWPSITGGSAPWSEPPRGRTTLPDGFIPN